jgi:hypothetical protein
MITAIEDFRGSLAAVQADEGKSLRLSCHATVLAVVRLAGGGGDRYDRLFVA